MRRVGLSERTIAGLERAKVQGRIGGRPKTEDAEPKLVAKIGRLRSEGRGENMTGGMQRWSSPWLETRCGQNRRSPAVAARQDHAVPTHLEKLRCPGAKLWMLLRNPPIHRARKHAAT
jgi:hypothetical protein